MVNKVISEEEVKLLLSSDYHKEEKEQTEKPKLTMKYLHELIRKLQYENLILAKRIDEFEQKVDLFHLIRAEAATTVELVVQGEPEMTAGKETGLETVHPHAILIPRSERHPVQKKKSFWTYWTSFWSRPRKRGSMI